MNKTLYFLIGLVALLILAGATYFLWPGSPSTAPGTSGTGTFPGQPYTNNSQVNLPPAPQGGSTKRYSIVGYDGMRMTVKDFINNGETAADPVNPGNYYLAGSIGYCLGNGTCPSGAKSDQFTLAYRRQGDAFTVGLLRQPIADSRAAAEKFLADRLGINQDEMCRLNYYVSVTSEVDEVYTGRNLGWSFCPGGVVFQ